MKQSVECGASGRHLTSRWLMQANVFRGPGLFGLEEKPVPKARSGEAVVQVRLTSICAADLQIARGRCRIAPGITLGHEAVCVIHELGAGVEGFELGQRVVLGAMCSTASGPEWRFGLTIDGAQAEFVRVPNPERHLAVVPDWVSDDEALLMADAGCVGFAAAEQSGIRLGDTVAVIGNDALAACVKIGALVRGAAEVFLVPSQCDLDAYANVGIETTGTMEGMKLAMRAVKPGGVLATLGDCCGHTSPPILPQPADKRLIVCRCPGGREFLERLLRLASTRHIELAHLISCRLSLGEIERAYDLFACSRNRNGKVAIEVT